MQALTVFMASRFPHAQRTVSCHPASSASPNVSTTGTKEEHSPLVSQPLQRWPVLLVAVGLVLALIYRFGPSREHPQWQWVSPGSAFAAVAWVIVSLAFAFYAENFGSYKKTYGTLGAAIGFMIWMWLSTPELN